jgi:hypothetical protein
MEPAQPVQVHEPVRDSGLYHLVLHAVRELHAFLSSADVRERRDGRGTFSKTVTGLTGRERNSIEDELQTHWRWEPALERR